MLDTRTATLRIVYLARLREALGRNGEDWAPASGETTVAAIIDTLRERGGAWSLELGPGRAVRVAVNHEMATPATVVRAGDEVALFPPVTGG
jgi:molybdopterin synthase sulfur carrier subunit